MGLPIFSLEFKKKAETAVSRSNRGVVAVILVDTTSNSNTLTSYSVIDKSELTVSHWSNTNLKYLDLVFEGKPSRVIIERVTSAEDYSEALARLANKRWDWLTVPGINTDDETEVKEIIDWLNEQREKKKTFKAVLPCSTAGVSPNNKSIVNFATDGVKTSNATYSSAEYCARIAGVLAGIAVNKSATYHQFSEITSITESTTPDADIDSGKLIIINDGEKFKIARAVTSLTTPGTNETDEMKKIKIVEAMDFIFDDIRDVFENTYIGTPNNYDNKQLFISEINDYFKELENQGVLEPNGGSYAEIDLEAQREWLRTNGKDVDNMTDDEIKKSKTGSELFMTGVLSFLDAIEDLKFSIYM